MKSILHIQICSSQPCTLAQHGWRMAFAAIDYVVYLLSRGPTLRSGHGRGTERKQKTPKMTQPSAPRSVHFSQQHFTLPFTTVQLQAIHGVMPPKRQASIKGFFTPSGNSGRQDVSSPAASSAGPATPLASDSETSTPRRGRATQAASQASSSRVRYQRQARTPSVESEGEEGLNNIRFSPERARWRPTTKRIVADDEDQSDQVVREVVNLATSSEDDEPAQNTSRLKRNASSSSSVSASPSAPRRKRKERAPPRRASRSSARAASASSVVVLCDSDDSSSAAPSPPATRLRRRSETQTQRRIRHIRGKRAGASQSETEEERGEQSDSFIVDDDEVPRIRREIRNARTTEGLSKKKRRLDPDDEDTADADTAEEDEHDLEMDEPERFKTSTRLRQRIETPHQRLLRKLHNKRNNIVSSGSEEEDDEEADVTVDDGPVVIDDSEGFITDDGGEFDDSLMPAEFSRGYAQSMEYKFKVFFQYLILLTIHGPGILPLKGEQKEYMKPAQELRAYFKGIRNGRVRGQIWKPEFVAALEKYPTFLVSFVTWLQEADIFRCMIWQKRSHTATRAIAGTNTVGAASTSRVLLTTTRRTARLRPQWVRPTGVTKMRRTTTTTRATAATTTRRQLSQAMTKRDC